MDHPQDQHYNNATPTDTAADSSHPRQSKRKILTIHPPPPPLPATARLPISVPDDTQPRRSSSISSQSSSIFSQSLPSSSAAFLPSSPLFRSSYNKLGGSTVGMGTVGGSMPGGTVIGFSPYIGQQSPYGAAGGRRGFTSSSTLSLLSSHPSSPIVSPSPASGAFFTAETRMQFDMDAIDVSESEASIDGIDSETETSGSEGEGDDILSIGDGSNSDEDESDSEDTDGFSSISTYDPTTSAANLQPSSAPSPSMMTGGRLGLLGGVQQTSDGNILRRSQESGRHGFSPKEATLAHEQQRFDTNSAVEVILGKGRIVEQGGPATVSEQDYEVNEDSESLGLSSPPSPTLSHSPLSHSSQSTSPSSPSLSISQHPLDSDFIPDACLPEALSSSSSFSTTIPIIPEVEEEVKPCAIAVETMDRSASILQDLNEMRTPELVSPAGVDDLLDEGVFEAEEDHGVKHDLHDNDKRQDDGSQVTIEGVDGYGSLPLYTTHATPAQQQNGTVQDSDSSSSSDAVIAELKEVRTILQDLHKRMDQLERTLQSGNSNPLVSRSSSSSRPPKDNPSSSPSPNTRRRGILSMIKGMGVPRRGGGGGLARVAILVLFFGLIVFGRRSFRRRHLRWFSLSSLLGTNWTTAAGQLARSQLGSLERRAFRIQ